MSDAERESSEPSPASAVDDKTPTAANNDDEEVMLTEEEYLAQAKKEFAVKEYSKAVESFAMACQLHAEEHGEDDPYLLSLYGSALFNMAVQNSNVLGDAPEKQQREMLDAHASKDAAAGTFEFAETVPVEEGEEPAAAEEEEQQDDMEAAWEVMDLARTLYAKREQTAEVKERLIAVYDVLGEISLESANFQQAVDDLEKCAALTVEVRGPEHVSECYYKLSLAYEYVGQPSSLKKSIACLQKAIDIVARKKGHDAEVLQELETRMEELNENLQEVEKSKREAIAGILGSVASGTVEATPANDISGLVRKRKSRPGADGGADGDTKKPKEDSS